MPSSSSSFFCLIALAPALFAVFAQPAVAQTPAANYDESKVPEYTLPDPLIGTDGKPVETADQWTKKRRSEIINLFAENVYGKTPPDVDHGGTVPVFAKATLNRQDREALGGKAICREYFTMLRIDPQKHNRAVELISLCNLLVYLPKEASPSKPVPAFVALNFRGNHAVADDPDITIIDHWSPYKDSNAEFGPPKSERGDQKRRWPIEMILERGYAVVTAHYQEIEPDFDGGIAYGFRRRLPRPEADQWGTVAAWAKGLSYIMDFIEQEKESAIDPKRVALLGHSRLGKAALWAGALDERFAIVISNNSGCGGAALSRREFGETVARINTVFPHWFCGHFKQYGDRVNDCPVDQHELIALIAPRPVYVASAVEDRWADPRGEFLAALHAEPVYKLLGRPGLGVTEMPPIDQSVGDTIGYHIRTGKHDVTDYDWARYLDFADRHFGRR